MIFVYGRVMQELPLSSWPAVIERVASRMAISLFAESGVHEELLA